MADTFYYLIALKEIPMDDTIEFVAAANVEHEEIHSFKDSIVIKTTIKLKDGEFLKELLPTDEIITSHESYNTLHKKKFTKRDNSGKLLRHTGQVL